MLLLLLPARATASERPPEGKKGTVIGIDLGTTFSCVGIFQNGKVEIIANEVGSRITPSVVSFGENDRLVGDAAKHQMTANPANTVYAVKRLMGLRYSDPQLQAEMKRLPYKIVDLENRPYIEVQHRGETKYFSPEEISAMILVKMKTIAEEYLGRPVKNAVVTVPAYFNDAQRKATMDAGEIAGLNVLRILNEPTAASLAYGLGRKGSKRILVFDLGGGTFDVSALVVDDGLFEVLATNGDTHLGGEDFDQRVIEYFKAVYKKRTGKDCSKNRKAVAKLKREAEKAKHALSVMHQVRVEIENFNDGDEFVETLTRARFEELNADLFRQTMNPVKEVMKDSNLAIEEIEEIVLVGGSTRIPKIQQLVRDFFKGKEPYRSIDPDEAVAHGAAVQAASLSDDDTGAQVILLNVNPMTLGIETLGGVMSPIIPRNSRVPISKKRGFTTVVDNQDQVNFHVYEGERPLTKDNHLLGEFNLTGIKPAPKSVPQLIVTFEIDADGMLVVSAEDTESQSRQSIKINAQEARLSDAKRDEAIRKAEDMRDQDENARGTAVARTRLLGFALEMRRQVEAVNATLNGTVNASADNEMITPTPLPKRLRKLNSEDVERLSEIYEEVFTWIDNHEHVDKELFDDKLTQVKLAVFPLLGTASSGDDDPLGISEIDDNL
jgi:heat shock protein 5